MIEIVLDENDGCDFCGKEYEIVQIKDVVLGSWSDYKLMASSLLENHKNEEAIILNITDNSCSLNKLSLALFVESVKNPVRTEYAVFKVSNLAKTRETYNPYIALTIAIKYALNLVDEEPKVIYKNISGLGYLGLEIERDYVANNMIMSLHNSNDDIIKIKTKNAFEALVSASALKALSLAKSQVSIEVAVEFCEDKCLFNKDVLVEKIIENVSPWIN